MTRVIFSFSFCRPASTSSLESMFRVSASRLITQVPSRANSGMPNMPNMPNPNFLIRMGMKLAPWGAGAGILGAWIVYPALPKIFPETFGDEE